jgi:hypothetical protein
MANDGKDKEEKKDASRSLLGVEDLKGYYYSYGSMDQTDQYIKTTKRIGEYAAQRFTKEIGILVEKGTEAVFEEPEEPGAKPSTAVSKKYELQLKLFFEKEERYKQDKHKVFRIIMGQCKTPMRNKLESLPEYESLEEQDDVAGLLETIRKLVYGTDQVQYKYWTMQSVIRTMVNLKQEKMESLQAFAKRFLSQLESTEEVWGKLIPFESAQKDPKEQNTERDKFLACLFLAGVDRDRYKRVIDELNNEFILGKVHYPEDVPSMLKYLTNRRGSGGNKKVEALRDGMQGIVLNQQGNNKNKKKKKPIECYVCGEEGHIASKCPLRKGKKDDSSVGSDNGSVRGWNHQGFQTDGSHWQM